LERAGLSAARAEGGGWGCVRAVVPVAQKLLKLCIHTASDLCALPDLPLSPFRSPLSARHFPPPASVQPSQATSRSPPPSPSPPPCWSGRSWPLGGASRQRARRGQHSTRFGGDPTTCSRWVGANMGTSRCAVYERERVLGWGYWCSSPGARREAHSRTHQVTSLLARLLALPSTRHTHSHLASLLVCVAGAQGDTRHQ